jgi:predicted dehydrogenase
MAGFSRRFDASYRNAKAKIIADTIGEPFILRSQTCDLIDNTGFFVSYARMEVCLWTAASTTSICNSTISVM